MAQHLDLEEQEQLDELKHFWREYGNLITWALIVVFGAIAAFNGWQYWQRTQAAQAAAIFDEADRAAAAGDAARVERAFADAKDKFPRTSFAQQTGLLAARFAADKGNTEAAKSALAWVAEKATDDGYRAVAKLRLAGVLADAKAYDDALKQLEGDIPKEFEALAADRRGDILSLQGKKAEAKEQYLRAWKAMDESNEYRRLVEVKLTSLGVDVSQLAAPAAPAASGAAKS